MDEVLAALRAWADAEEGLSCTVADALGRTNGMDASVRPMWTGARFVGRAVTAYAADGDLGAVLDAIDAAGAGDAIVVQADSATAVALWGENTSLSARNQGAVGVVLGAPCRDVAAHAQIGFPVFATGATPRAGTVRGSGQVQRRVVVGGVEVTPGDVIVADENGVTVIPQGRLGEVVAALPAMLERERATRARLERGGTLGKLRAERGGG